MTEKAAESEEEEASLIDSTVAQLQPPQPLLTLLRSSRLRWVVLLAGALLALAGLLMVITAALQWAELWWYRDGVDDSGSAVAANFQAWLLDELQPLPPRLLPPADPHKAVLENGVGMFRQAGENYAMGSASSRLQRLPLLTEHWDEACRFTFNPTILRRRPTTGLSDAALPGDSFDFHLSSQLGSYAVYRSGGRTRVDERPWKWRFEHVLTRLSIDQLSDGRFQLRFSDARRWQVRFSHDLRLLHHDGMVLAYDNLLNAVHVQLNGSDIVVNDTLSTRRQLKPADDEKAKNFMAASVQGEVFYVQRFSPFIVVTCGDHLRPTDCAIQTQLYLHDSLLPKYHRHWRGSTTLLPLPSHPHLLLGLVHERSVSARDKTRDVYFNRFVLVDSRQWIPFAFTPSFGMFANLTTTRWFEFVMGMEFLGSSEVVLTFGYNDQEPWLAIVPLHGVMRALQPVLLSQQAELTQLKADYNRGGPP